MIIARLIGFPEIEHFYILVFLLTLTAFYKGVRGWESDQEEVPWLTHAWTGRGVPWILTCAISFVQIFNFLVRSGTIPFQASEQLQGPWLALFYLVLGLAMLGFAGFYRLLLVWLGFEWRSLFWRVGNKNAVRQGDWKLIRERGAWQLYNLAHDTGFFKP
jgi:hypothetical protein